SDVCSSDLNGEFGVVARGHTLVAEVAVDLEDLLEAADDQALEVQLRGDAQVHGQVQRVVVGLERLGRRAARDHLQHRGLDFQEVALGKELDRKSTRLNSSHVKISYAVFCLKKKTD